VPCCRGQNYDRLFDDRTATRQLRSYRRKGATGVTRRLLQAVRASCAPGASLLDIGGGVGVLQHELARAGAGRVTAVDASTPYLAAARAEVERLGYLERWQAINGDFVEASAQVPAADVVTLDKVICCYPDMVALVQASAAKAQKLWAIVVPRDRWWVRWGAGVINAVLRILRQPFRTFIHALAAIDATAARQGLTLRQHDDGLVWTVRLYQR
jgi:predicted TPR repeat methyltransferase